MDKNKMTPEAAARIQANEAKQGPNYGEVEKGGFAARAQSAAARNEAANQEAGAKHRQ